jgi:predicted site-specific integrase-resolvase
MSAMAEPLFEYDEKMAASIVGVTPRTLRAWRKAGAIGYHRTPGGRVRYTMDQLIDFKRASRVPAARDRLLPPSSA